MKVLIYLYLTVVGGLVVAILFSLLVRLFPKRCPGCQRLSLPLPMTVDGREALVCTRADCRFKGDDETWRLTNKETAKTR